jgi:Meiotically up-regulated gene 113
MHSFIYFVRQGDRGPVKIGITNEAPPFGDRLSDLQVGNPERLSVIHFIRGADKELEREIHRRLEKHRIRGEWFKPSGAVYALVDLPEKWCEGCGRRPLLWHAQRFCATCRTTPENSDTKPLQNEGSIFASGPLTAKKPLGDRLDGEQRRAA